MATRTSEFEFADSHPAMSWRATIAGLLVSFLIFGILLSLGVALGGVSLTDGANLRNSGILGAVWMLLSIFFALFAGSYFSGRISTFVASWAGVAQGSVLCALFLGILLWQFVGLATWMTKSAGNLVGGAVQAGAPLAQGVAHQLDIGMNDIIEDNLGGVQLKGDARTIAGGLASRLIRGETESAKNYLARNSTLTRTEVDQRIESAQSQLTAAGERAREATAGALKITGWSLFVITLLGLIVSISGGVAGLKAKRKTTVFREESAAIPPFRPATT
ncbi:MAG: hypothetical protein ACAH59_03245 [Pseudobdellovibrionaceae bacterium]